MKLELVVIYILLLAFAASSPMLYKRNPDEKYEPDLVAISSTVIPLTVLEVSYGLGGKPSDEYKAAYLRKLRKQVQQKAAAQASGNSTALRALSEVSELPPAPSDADALITLKSKQQEKAKVKAV
ncbi:uncharacterized protein LOC6585740 [Drosophila mojavensis]|uniref:Uncharacterized protein n=1 Tax=Drosophila mojavensis TaxID=7230 RepID=B4L762_DROMO|nr:uncharacterized protein LOC6585740 [Drosophila mojavensis]EDW06208.1 uncharacterized protein Dmoj_GI16037 [Drosophila mojavensis]